MGVVIYANGSDLSFDCGAGGFMNLRCNIADAFDKEFGEHYRTLTQCISDEDYRTFDEKTQVILSNDRFKNEDIDIVDFLFASDLEGNISYKTCGKIYHLVKDINYGTKMFCYAFRNDGKDYERLKAFLKDCYTHRRKMRWR